MSLLNEPFDFPSMTIVDDLIDDLEAMFEGENP